MNFTERLKEYRKELDLNKKEMSEKLDIKESYYNMIENGKRKPPKTFLYKLVDVSKKPEEYWLYGIGEQEYKDERELAKSTRIALEQALELGLIKNFDTLFDGSEENKLVEELLIAALKSDLSYLITDKK